LASPQIEKGYTRIANEILEATISSNLNSTQVRIIMVIWRYTYGFNRKQHQLSETFIAKATGISKRYISSEIKKLINKKIINIVTDATFTEPRTISFNKNYDTWIIDKKIQQVKDCSTPEQFFSSTGEELFHTTGEELFHQERNVLKKEYKEIYIAHFDFLWTLYPHKRGKAKIKDKQKEKLYKLGDEIIRAIERYKVAKENWKEWQYGSTFFNGGYLDYLDDFEEVKKESKPAREIRIGGID